jgi:hypothetical protein
MTIALILQAASPAASTVTLAEARGMSPSALAARLLPEERSPFVDAIINGRSVLTPPGPSVNRVWLVEQMVPFDATVCRSHLFEIEMGADDPAANLYSTALPTHPVNIEQYDRLWVPPTGVATASACAAAPAEASGFGVGGLGLRQAAAVVEQARTSFALAARHRNVTVSCRSERGACGESPGKTLASIDWSALGVVEQVTPEGERYDIRDPKPADPVWGAPHVRFTFPYAAGHGATWVITVDRAPDITAVRMEAESIIYE